MTLTIIMNINDSGIIETSNTSQLLELAKNKMAKGEAMLVVDKDKRIIPPEVIYDTSGGPNGERL